MKIIYNIDELKEKINILIITAADCEKKAINEELHPLDNEDDILEYRHDEDEYFIGKFGKYNVVHVKSDEGNLGSHSSLMTMYKTLVLWNNLKIVIMLGIACGKKTARQEIGDILVPQEIFYYEKCKMIEKDDKLIFDKIVGDFLLEPSRKLFQIFSDNSKWSYEINVKENKKRQVQIHKGTIFSGEKIIASTKAQEMISKLYSGNCIGFDMEGAGIAYACKNLKFENWILIKGISDFGNEQSIKDKNRQKAIKSIIEYCKSKFNKEDTFRDFLMSSDELYQIEINRTEKKKFDLSEQITTNYISRKVILKSKLSFYNDEESKITLYDAITKCYNKIVLLSDAGLGKTEEAKNLVNEILKRNNNLIAFYKNLNSYSDKKIIELLPSKLKNTNLENIVFVLDRIRRNR